MWNVEGTDEFRDWFWELSEAEQVAVAVGVDLLEQRGPALDRPWVDTLKGSKHRHMKELRVQHAGKPYRILFAFDPRRSAILLIGGMKAGDKRFYDRMIPIADRLYDRYLDDLKQEGLI